ATPEVSLSDDPLSPGPDSAARRARLGVAGLFTVNGLGYPSVVPWLPTIKSHLELSNAALGTAIAAMPLGALLTGMLAGPIIARFGSGRTAVVCSLLSAWTLPVVALAPNWWVLAAALFVIGSADTWSDSAMNVHGLRVQRRYGRSIINTFHAEWSVAAVTGGQVGSVAIGVGLPLLVHLAGEALALTVLTVVSQRVVLDRSSHARRAHRHGLRVQRRYGRSIINTFHAVWSVAAVTGGLVGSVAIGVGLPLLVHLAGVALALTVLSVGSSRLLLDGPEHAERADGHGLDGGRTRPAAGALGLLAALGVLLMLAAAVEDAAASWGGVYLRDEIGTAAFLAGLPFVACQTSMTLGRLVGDRLTDAFGAVAVARAGLLLSAAGLAGALLLPNAVTTVVGFGLCGLGVATLFPLTLAAAGEIPGVRSGDGVAAVSWLARLGFLAFPPLVGLVA